MGTLSYTAYSSSFGRGYVVWTRGALGLRILRILLPSDEEARRIDKGMSVHEEHAGLNALIECLGKFFRGENVAFSLELLDLDACSDFQKRVLLTEALVPRGRVTTYGAIARHLGFPGAARAVGRALATNPFPLVIPCHRCVRENGNLGGYRGGLEMKRALLKMEGVSFVAGAVETARIWSDFPAS